MDPNTISAIANSVTALGITLVAYQVSLYRRELIDDHDRSRRENAITFLMEWTKGLGHNSSLTRKLVEQLDDDQTLALVEMRPFSISSKFRSLIAGCLQPDHSVDDLFDSNGEIQLTETHVKIIKWQLVSYVNLLEAILSAWRHNTADRDMIEEQFQYLVAPERGLSLFERYRKVVNGPHTLPAITEFAATILKKRSDEKSEMHNAQLQENSGKPAIGIKAPKGKKHKKKR